MKRCTYTKINLDNEIFKDAPITEEEKQLIEKKIVKEYLSKE